MPRRVVMVAGEASGDLYGAALVRALRARLGEVDISGIGGPAMAAEGVALLHRAEELALVGILEVVPKLRQILAALNELKRHLATTRPDLVILIDFPDFNFRVGKAAKALGLPVLYYVCPQVWAWRRGRARAMAGFVDRLAAVFPFELEFLRELAPELKAEFVGHPQLDQPPPDLSRPLPVPEGATLVGLLPGSRHSEVKRILPVLFKTAALLRARRPDLHFLLPLAPGLERAALDPFLPLAPPGLTVLKNRAAQVMAASRLCLVASGTATLQAALAGAPLLVVYRIGLFNYLVGRALIKVSFIAMPNLVAGRQVVPEFIQGAARPAALAAAALALLADGGPRAEMLAGLAEVKDRMGGPGASERVAGLAAELMGEASAV